jgi:high-affinity nickel-transport protein
MTIVRNPPIGIRISARAVRIRKIAVCAAVVSANLGAWLVAWLMLGGNTVLMGSAVLAYSLGLRHAVDADHIAAIDNATRKLMHDGKRPVTVGLWFSLGHSTIVVLLSLMLVLTATGIRQQLSHLAVVGATVGVVSSCLVLLVLAAMNAYVLAGLVRTFRAIRKGQARVDGDSQLSLLPVGPLGRVASRLFRLISASWHLYPLGVLFGLGFDTATEIGLLGLSAASAVQGLGLWTIMIFPALFTAGMSLIDTADSILMLNVYSWSFVRPMRKLYYNLTVTAISVAVALLVGTMEALALLQAHMGLSGPFWGMVAMVGRNFGLLGYAVVLLFAASWIVSIAIYKLRGYDEIDMPSLGH